MSEKKEVMASSPESGAPGAQPAQFALDTGSISTIYTNFCHVTWLPEELILDFGLNTQTQPTPNQPIKLSHRVVMNYYTAKRLLHGLQLAVSHYEKLFGAMEVDYQKRVKTQPGR